MGCSSVGSGRSPEPPLVFQTWISRMSPSTPPQISSTARRKASLAVPWLPNCVATFFSAARSRRKRSLIDIVRQRLFAEHALAHANAPRGNDRVGIVRRGHGDRVDLLVHLVEHLAKVVVLLCLGDRLVVRCSPSVVHIAHSNDIGKLRHGIREPTAPPGDPDYRHVHLAVGRVTPRRAAVLQKDQPHAAQGSYS